MNYAAPGTAGALDAAPLPVEAHAEDNVITIDLRQTALLRVQDGVLTIGAEQAERLAEALYDAVNELTTIEPADADRHNTDTWDQARDAAVGA